MERAEFESLREAHVDRIREDLQEAARLMGQLNKNLEIWGERTGETQALAQVWDQFQSQLSVLSGALLSMQEPPK